MIKYDVILKIRIEGDFLHILKVCSKREGVTLSEFVRKTLNTGVKGD